MQDGQFGWSDAETAANWRDRGVSIHDAIKAFRDPLAIERIDDREDYGEERINLIGMCQGVLLHVTYTGTNAATSPGSSRPRRATRHEQDDYYRENGRGGARRRQRAAVSEEADAADDGGGDRGGRCGDPDARPMTLEELRTARRVPRVKTLRRALGLTQQEFAARYRMPLGTLRDWEQGRTIPRGLLGFSS
jgi:DNA-binding transcriptional regulator YiaG/uncharacterized DUF497 family protein